MSTLDDKISLADLFPSFFLPILQTDLTKSYYEKTNLHTDNLSAFVFLLQLICAGEA